eukprot:690482-Rhodomonas_salina.2
MDVSIKAIDVVAWPPIYVSMSATSRSKTPRTGSIAAAMKAQIQRSHKDKDSRPAAETESAVIETTW